MNLCFALKYFILCGLIIPFLDFCPKKLLEAYPGFNINVLIVVIFVIIKVVRNLPIRKSYINFKICICVCRHYKSYIHFFFNIRIFMYNVK